jgi:hypothetical protein
MKTFTTPLFLIASLAMAVSAMAAPTASPFINHKDPAAVKLAAEQLGYTVSATDSPLGFTITIDGNDFNLAVGECPAADTCGIGVAYGLVDVAKKPTDGWLARMNAQGGLALISYNAANKQVEINHTFTLDGINKDALNFSLKNTHADIGTVFESIDKNEHLKK